MEMTGQGAPDIPRPAESSVFAYPPAALLGDARTRAFGNTDKAVRRSGVHDGSKLDPTRRVATVGYTRKVCCAVQ